MKISFVRIVACCSLLIIFFSGCASEPRHPNLANAQQFVQQAMEKVSDAQKANNFDMQGHAARAKALMRQAMEEIRLAEQAADNN